MEEFKAQLANLRRHYHLCSPSELFDCLKTNQSVPENWALLTFDDGYSDHFRYVLPVLDDNKLSAFFFPPASVVEDRSLLDVNKIHFILSACPSVQLVCARLESILDGYGYRPEDIGSLKEKYFHANRFDGPETIFIKRILQKGLPFEVRSRIASQLFAEFVSVDEEAFAEELYLNLDECRTMARVGMVFGSHGRNHYWMGDLQDKEQDAEIKGSIAFLNKIHQPETKPLPGLAMCYPYGSYNAYTVAAMKSFNFDFALTTKVGDADFSATGRYEVKRYDTNDFPFN